MEIKFGEIIKSKRQEKQISLVDFADKLDISPGYLSQLENGRKSNPNLEVILKVIKELDLNMEMLLGLDENKTNSIRVPSLLGLILAKDRNCKVLENTDILKKFCALIDEILGSKYAVEKNELYKMFLDDIIEQLEILKKRYSRFNDYI